MKIKKIHSQAKTPTRGSYDSAGYDLYSIEHAIIPPHRSAKLGTGLCMEMEKGTVGLIWERSKLASKFGLQVMGGVIAALTGATNYEKRLRATIRKKAHH